MVAEVSGWIEESELQAEREQWLSWNGHSPEQEFCEFAAAFINLIKPKLVIETGMGQGYMTRRARAAMPSGSRYVGFETHPDFHKQAVDAGVETHNGPITDSVGIDLVRQADLTILDSAGGPVRLSEIEAWHTHAKERAFVLIHDVSYWHDSKTTHYQHYQKIVDECIPGIFINNPRGSFLGQK